MKKIFIYLVLTGILVAAGWFGRGAYRDYKEKRYATQAERFVEEGETAKAILSARQALSVNPNNLPSHRVMAFIAEAGASANALTWRKRIAELEPTLDNQIILASCALRFEAMPYPTATATLGNIVDKASTHPAFHVVAGRLALQMNDRKKAEHHMAEAIRLDPKAEANRLNLAAIRLRSEESGAQEEARRTLLDLRSSEKMGSDALRWLMTDLEDKGDYMGAIRFSKELLLKKEAHEDDRFAHLALLQRAKSNEFEPFLASLKTKAGSDADGIYRVVAWQIAVGLPEEALKWIDSLPVAVQAKRPVPVGKADALAALEEWRKLSDFLRDEKWEEQEFLRRALLARALKMQNEPDAAKANWDRAVEAASEKAENLALLSQLSGKWKWESETELLLWRIVQRHPEQTWAMNMINHVYEANKNTPGLLRVNEARLRGDSANTIAMNNVAMLSFLLMTNLPASHVYAQQVYKADPKNLGYVSTYAYSLHLQGKTAEAINLLKGLEASDLQRPSLAAYYAIFLSAAGEKEKGKQFARMVDSNRLLPEERSLFEAAQRKL